MDNTIKILVVDDFVTMRNITRTFLSELGFTRIEEADDGLTALPLLEAQSFDFLITDWNMPGMTGIELTRAVRANPELAQLPILMVTSEARRDQILAAAEAGVNGYIVKPFSQETLRDHIDQVFERLAVA
jgi:two-component system chemotaxis response regulator CheY|tara:strand:+ start:2126 stop:2515 length:390 start_codon:yes stop_codon:yes gene_type:complete